MNRVLLSVAAVGLGLAIAGSRGCTLPVIPGEKLIDAPGLNVLIVEESGDRQDLPPKQAAIFSSVAVRQFVGEQGGEMLIVDPSNAPLTPLADKWRKALDRPRASLPWAIVSKDGRGVEGPLPGDVAAFMGVLTSVSK